MQYRGRGSKTNVEVRGRREMGEMREREREESEFSHFLTLNTKCEVGRTDDSDDEIVRNHRLT